MLPSPPRACTPAPAKAHCAEMHVPSRPRGADGLLRLNAFGASWMGVLVMPVYVPFLLSRGLRTADVLDLQAIYGLAVMLLDVPTGLACDRLGRRRTMVLGACLNLLGLLGFAAAHGFAALAAVQLVLASGWSLVSGADVAMIYDVLDRRGADRDARRRALGAYTLAQVGGEAGAALLGGFIAAWSLPALGWLTAAEAVLPLLLALSLPEGALRPAGAAVTLRAVPRALREVLGAALPRLLFVNWVLWGLSTFIAVWLLQPYWQQGGVPLRWFGPLWAATLLTVGATGRLAPGLVRLAGPRTSFLLLAALPVLGYGGMAVLGGAPGVAAGFLFYASRGLNAVVLREAFNHHVPSALRATFNSIGSGTSRLGYAAAGPVIGLVIDAAGLRAALGALAVAFLLVLLGLGLPLARRLGASAGSGR